MIDTFFAHSMLHNRRDLDMNYGDNDVSWYIQTSFISFQTLSVGVDPLY